MFSTYSLVDFLNLLGPFKVLISIGISIIIAISGVLPSIFMTGANVVVFGPINGFLVSWLGETLGAGVSFFLYRLGFKKRFDKLSTKHKILYSLTKANGLKAGILTLEARLIPFIPSGFVTFACSVSSMDFGLFILSSSLGKLPSIALEALVSYDVINLYTNWIRLVVVVFSILLLAITYKLFMRGK